MKSRPAWDARASSWLASTRGCDPTASCSARRWGEAMLPVSAFVATHEVMQVFRPGDHGSTFGGNPLAADASRWRRSRCSATRNSSSAAAEMGRPSAGPAEDRQEPPDSGDSRQGALRRPRGRCPAHRRARHRRSPAAARIAVEGHPRHGRALRPPAGDHARGDRLGGRAGARSVRRARQRHASGGVEGATFAPAPAAGPLSPQQGRAVLRGVAVEAHEAPAPGAERGFLRAAIATAPARR